ncbi:hypothetical protein CF15_04860 [Pyrodictium occultum]|uniref:DUF1641 domain-containing protein n=1 Tax=Pyrodictium occultum TaxID=2309 RepID=A0A0V8RVQ8_PYROC|nr:DUF1641 domain-containing protein [Pyrodictium occultum]KSW12104.1 hypothetical protein CF15_04860 [Pyrodictium occultum]
MASQAGEKRGTIEEALKFDEESMKALEDIIEALVYLKKSGMLDMLKFIAEKSNELFTILSRDPTLYRLLALTHGATRGINSLEPEEVVSAKLNVEGITSCTMKSMASLKPSEVKPLGLLGLMGALRDPEVQHGIGLLIAMAKHLGACLLELKKKFEEQKGG